MGIEVSSTSHSIYNHDIQWHNGATALADLHDGAASRSWWREMPPLEALVFTSNRVCAQIYSATAFGNWNAVVASEPQSEKTILTLTPKVDVNAIFSRQLRPLLALADAKLGNINAAQELIATTPGDCYDCIRIRGEIAAESNHPNQADYWFDRAVHDAPSIPFAYNDWGRALLDRGMADAAIEKFKLANQRGPHFADPLEGWGEALMAKNKSHLALAKFAEADKYAPNWGRLHLKWGEALVYAGRKDEARTQYQKSSTLDLTQADKAELARVSAHG
jgi:predicted Zn-dependent protease